MKNSKLTIPSNRWFSCHYQDHTISMIEDQMNEFLETIEEKDFVNMKLVLRRRDNTSPSEFYAIIIYRQK